MYRFKTSSRLSTRILLTRVIHHQCGLVSRFRGLEERPLFKVAVFSWLALSQAGAFNLIYSGRVCISFISTVPRNKIADGNMGNIDVILLIMAVLFADVCSSADIVVQCLALAPRRTRF